MIEESFAKRITEPVTFSESQTICSRFGVFELDEIRVEIMGDIEKRQPNGTWESPVDVTEHLQKLVAAGVVGKATLPTGERSRDLPYTFYYVTDEGRDLFDRNDIFDESVWREQYEKMEKTPEIEAIEAIDRPSPE